MGLYCWKSPRSGTETIILESIGSRKLRLAVLRHLNNSDRTTERRRHGGFNLKKHLTR